MIPSAAAPRHAAGCSSVGGVRDKGWSDADGPVLLRHRSRFGDLRSGCQFAPWRHSVGPADRNAAIRLIAAEDHCIVQIEGG